MLDIRQNEAERIAGRAYGVMFFAGFGSLWMLIGLAAMHLLNWATGALVVAVLLALVLPAMCLERRAQAGRPAVREDAEHRRVQRTFHRINGAQYVAIPLVIAGMNLLHRPEWIAPGIAIVVGLHLLPLARLFRNPANSVTGAALIAYGLFSMAVLPRAEAPSLGALGAAAILLGSATYTLLASRATLAARGEAQLA